MRVYLDLCVYNRPFDDQAQPRIMMETLGLIIIMASIPSGEIETVNSFALEYENQQNPSLEREEIILDMLQSSAQFVEYAEDIQRRAEILEGSGIIGMDAFNEYAPCIEELFFTLDIDNNMKRFPAQLRC